MTELQQLEKKVAELISENTRLRHLNDKLQSELLAQSHDDAVIVNAEFNKSYEG